MATVSGTMNAVEVSEEIVGRVISIKMNFAGTASVDIEERMPDGDWIKVETAITADARRVFDSPSVSAIRLNCTAYTNDVEYVMATGDAG